MPASREVSSGVSSATAEARREAPERLYVRRERVGRLRLMVWGIEHAGVLCEVVETLVPGRPSAAGAIERDLRRGVGLL